MLMFLVALKRPLRPVRQAEVTVKICKKTVWAIDSKGHRHLIGSSAFQTLPAAERCRFALLKHLAEDPFINKYYPHLRISAKAQMDTIH